LNSGAASNLADLGLFNMGVYTGVGNAWFNGSISELTVFSSALDATARQALDDNQLANFGIETANWTGATDQDWEKPSNWSTATVPTALSPSVVVIPAGRLNYPNITGTSVANSIVVNSSATVTIASGGKLRLAGTLSNSGTFSASAGTIELMGTSAQAFSLGSPVFNLIINNGSGVSLNGNLNISSNLTFSAGNLSIGVYSLTLGGTVTNTVSGALRGGSNSSITVTGNPTLSFDQNSTNNQLRNLVINGSGQVVTLASNLVIAGGGTGLTFSNGMLAIGSNTLTLRGGVVNTASGGIKGSSTSNLIIDGALSPTLSFDQTTPGTTDLLNNLSISTTSANTVTLGSNVSVNGTLTVIASQILNLGTYALGGTLTTITNNGTITTQNTSGTPLPASKTWGGTVSYNAASAAQTVSGGTYNNLTLISTGGATASGNITVNGILNLAASNPTSSKGLLTMGDYTLNMGAFATTTGPSANPELAGDVTGIVKRTSFAASTPYTFGNPFTSVTIAAGGTMPTDLSIKIAIGTAPSWKSTAVQRTYDIVRTGGLGTTVTLALHYLDSELQANTESNLVTWDYHPITPKAEEHGKANQDMTENWVAISNRNITYFGTAFDAHPWGLSAKETATFTWQGTPSSDWNDANNWAGGVVPGAASDVLIPDAGTTVHDPLLPATASVKTITIAANGILNGGTGTNLTIAGSAGAWLSLGTFNAGTSTVIFTHANATMADPTNFYNVTIATGAALTPGTDNVMRIAGTFTNSGTLRAALNPNTIEFNGADQTIINPNGLTPGYYNLILSGSGTKTMPGAALNIAGDFTLSGTASATAASSLTVAGSVDLQTGAALNGATFTHSIAGNWTNSGGTFTPATSTLDFNGTAAQTITDAAGFSVNNLSISNTASPVTLGSSTNCTVGGTLSTAEGAIFDLAANVLSSVATISNSGTIRTSAPTSATTLPVPSGKTWGGTIEFTGSAAQTCPVGTFSNLLMSGSGGATAGGNLTVNGILTLAANPSATFGILETGAYSLLMGGTATTTGAGDVTGKVSRTSLSLDTPYSFGNQFSTVTLTQATTLPSSISLKIDIGTVPSWKSGAVARSYDLISSGGSAAKAVINLHYLDSELNENEETELVQWMYQVSGEVLTDLSRSNFNTTDNWVAIANTDLSLFPSAFGEKAIAFDESGTGTLTWNGSVSTNWTTTGNWTPTGTPNESSAILIPDAAETPNDPTAPLTAVGTITLENGAILNTETDASITLNGAGSAWSNQGGTFNAGTSIVYFTNAGATINGSTSFNHLTISSGAALILTTGSTTRIAGTVTNNGTLNAALFENNVEYNGASQSVIAPNGTEAGYHNLILSGSGTKTFPATSINIYGDLTANAAVATTGNTLVMCGSTEQSIGGTTAPALNNLTVSNTSSTVSATSALSCAGNFTNSGTLNMQDNVLEVTGSVSNTGTIRTAVSTASSTTPIPASKTWGGTVEFTGTASQTAVAGTFNNLTLSGTGGAVAGGNLTVNGVLALTAANPAANKGILDLDIPMERTLTMGGSATTTGTGDVTGFVERTTFVAGTDYSFGNTFTTINFTAGGTLPTMIKVKIAIGAAPSWKTEAIQRTYDFIHTGGSDCYATVTTHYLDSELNGNLETLLVHWTNGSGGQAPAGEFEWGRSAQDLTNNWIQITGVNIAWFPTILGRLENTLSESGSGTYTWNGSVSSAWANVDNWTPAGSPSATTPVIIPAADLTPNDPALPESSSVKTITLNSGSILNGGTGTALSVTGSTGAWTNSGGTFIPGTSTVTFSGETAQTISGSSLTTFYNLAIGATSAGTGLDAGTPITIDGTLTTNGKLTINSSASASGSLIVAGTSSGNITYNRYMTNGKWHLISSPVVQTVSSFLSANTNLLTQGSSPKLFGLGLYDESVRNWRNFTDNSGDAFNNASFIPGKGYEIILAIGTGVSFSGTLTNGDVGITALHTPEITYPGWNLIGNPFPSHLHIKNSSDTYATTNFLSTANLAILETSYNAIYYWDPDANQYQLINNVLGDANLSPGQSFFIKAKTGGGALTFAAASRTHSSSTFKSGQRWPSIDLTVQTTGNSAKTLIRYIPGTTKGLDPGYDAGLFEPLGTFKVFTRLVEDNGVGFYLQCLPEDSWENTVIPVGLQAPAGAAVTFSMETDALPPGLNIYLEDKQARKFVRLNQPGSVYPVTLVAAAAGTGRFYLHTTYGSLAAEEIPMQELRIQPFPQQQLINIYGSVPLPSRAVIYDLSGRALESVPLNDQQFNTIPFYQPVSGIYVIEIQTGSTSFRKKISWVR
jgi:hypothetical protein